MTNKTSGFGHFDALEAKFDILDDEDIKHTNASAKTSDRVKCL